MTSTANNKKKAEPQKKPKKESKPLDRHEETAAESGNAAQENEEENKETAEVNETESSSSETIGETVPKSEELQEGDSEEPKDENQEEPESESVETEGCGKNDRADSSDEDSHCDKDCENKKDVKKRIYYSTSTWNGTSYA